ncbi:biotin carboxyl carrier protein [Neorhizobium galegae]|uniref:hypothetical protein n=1 Tax=Neorhizobium galegae TaxID=399 RepID=UPI001AE0EC75|nr:hypothetical protein [Neorhizobium galegae]MBP2563319.1 biotin carboxyl carrier protein [Neorhizobium galegae]
MPRLLFKSPKATRIAVVHANSGTRVSKGDLLLELHDWEEQKIMSQIKRGFAENAIKETEIQGPRVQEKIAALAQIANQRQVALQASQDVYAAQVDGHNNGQGSIIDVVRARQDMALRSYQVLQAAVELEIVSRNVSDSLTIFSSVSSILTKEESYVSQARDRLKIKAPSSGVFDCYVLKGTPVRLGHLLGEIKY